MTMMLSTMSGTVAATTGELAWRHAEASAEERPRISSSALAKTFRAAVLLTGGIRQAEAALLDVIQQVDPRNVSDQTFFADCLRASMAPGRQSQATAEDAEDASAILAPELKRILLLKPHLRHGLVLRVLLGLSEEDCARLNIRDAGRRACAASQELARIRRAERELAAA
jgi:hypothetical protein